MIKQIKPKLRRANKHAPCFIPAESFTEFLTRYYCSSKYCPLRRSPTPRIGRQSSRRQVLKYLRYEKVMKLTIYFQPSHTETVFFFSNTPELSTCRLPEWADVSGISMAVKGAVLCSSIRWGPELASYLSSSFKSSWKQTSLSPIKRWTLGLTQWSFATMMVGTVARNFNTFFMKV